MDSLDTALAAADSFRSIDSTIGVQTISVLLQVAKNNGRLIVSDLERLCGLTRTGASRNISLLSSHRLTDGRHGYGLVEYRNSDSDRRIKYLGLTKTGEQIIAKIRAAIEGRKVWPSGQEEKAGR